MKTPTFLLAVDDRPENLFVLKELVDQHLPECALVTANNAEAGLALAAKRSFDGVLIDVQMPGTDGIEMCRRLKADQRNGHLPILLVTAHGSTAELRIRGLEAGADDFISRPIDNVELVAKIRVMLRIKRAEDELREFNARLEELVAERTGALRKSEEGYRILAERNPHGIQAIDPTGIITYVNPAYQEMVGYTKEELLGKHIVDLLEPASRRPELREYLSLLVKKQPEPTTYFQQNRRKDGEVIEQAVSWNYSRDGEGNVVGFISVITDITQRKRDEEELSRAKEAAEAANRVKSQFLANMSHEIRTPMTAIMGYTDLLLSCEWPNAERREHLQVVKRNSQHLLTIINDILDLSKIESEEIELELAQCSASEVVEEVRSLLQVSANEKQLGLDVQYREPFPSTIRTDSVRLRQILVNLVGNAIKFTEKGVVKITVGCTRQDDGSARMQFEVADTGIGISAEEMDRLFQPFTQADMTFTRRFGGTGLGLAISQRLARLLGGQIEVRSEPGKGSTFILTIDPGPLESASMVQAPAARLTDTQKPAQEEPGQQLAGFVLLAEDDPDIRPLLVRNLVALGLEVDTAEDGRIACEKALASRAQGRPYGLILMDIQMPELDGHEATRRLRREGWKGPIVAVTAHAMDGDREKCLTAGCDDYVSKPITSEELLATVARHLDRATPSLSAGAAGI